MGLLLLVPVAIGCSGAPKNAPNVGSPPPPAPVPQPTPVPRTVVYACSWPERFAAAEIRGAIVAEGIKRVRRLAYEPIGAGFDVRMITADACVGGDGETCGTEEWKSCENLAKRTCYGQPGRVFCDARALGRILHAAALMVAFANAVDPKLEEWPLDGFHALLLNDGVNNDEDKKINNVASYLLSTSRTTPPFVAIDHEIFGDAMIQGLRLGAFDSGVPDVPKPEDGMLNAYRVAANDILAFVVGHELRHASSRCPFPDPSWQESSGRFQKLAEAQASGAGICRQDVRMEESNADRCALRAVSAIERRTTEILLKETPSLAMRSLRGGRFAAQETTALALLLGLGNSNAGELQVVPFVQDEGGRLTVGAPMSDAERKLCTEKHPCQATFAPDLKYRSSLPGYYYASLRLQMFMDTLNHVPRDPVHGPSDAFETPTFLDAGLSVFVAQSMLSETCECTKSDRIATLERAFGSAFDERTKAVLGAMPDLEGATCRPSEEDEAAEQGGRLAKAAMDRLEKHDWSEAEKGFRAAALAFRPFASSNPARFEPSLASALMSLAYALVEQGKPQEAAEAFEESATVHRAILKRDKQATPGELAKILRRIGAARFKVKQTEKAGAAYGEAVALFRELSKTEPDAFRIERTSALVEKSIVDESSGHLVEAREAVREAIRVLEGGIGNDRERVAPKLAKAKERLRALETKVGAHGPSATKH